MKRRFKLQIEGSRITLRDWHEADLERYEHWLTFGAAWKKLDAPYYPAPSAEEIPALIAKKREEIAAARWPSPRTRLIIAQEDVLIGMVSAYWVSEETDWLAVGIVIYDPACWGQGIGFEALGLWSDYLLREMPRLVRLDLRTWSGNRGMMRLAEKLGYQQEACFRKARIVDGAYYDGLGYGVLREEWDARYPHGFAAD